MTSAESKVQLDKSISLHIDAASAWQILEDFASFCAKAMNVPVSWAEGHSHQHIPADFAVKLNDTTTLNERIMKLDAATFTLTYEIVGAVMGMAMYNTTVSLKPIGAQQCEFRLVRDIVLQGGVDKDQFLTWFEPMTMGELQASKAVLEGQQFVTQWR